MKHAFAALALLSFAPVQEPAVDWVADYATAVKQARSSGKPLLVVFR